jgi:hypothetical protein
MITNDMIEAARNAIFRLGNQQPPTPEEMRMALDAAEQASWQPIASIPKDKLVDILVYDKRYCDCYYNSIYDEWRTMRSARRMFLIKEATHWCYSPTLPGDKR